MLKALVKKQLLELYRSYFIDKKTGKAKTAKQTVVSFVLLAVLFVGVGGSFFAMSSGLGVAILGNGCDWLYFAMMGLFSIALGVFGSVFSTYASLYLPKDNELLFSMPIPPRTLLLSRAVGVYLMSLLYSAWIWIPASIAYWVLTPVTAAKVLFPVLLTFLIALFVSVLSCLLGWGVALIAAKTKGKSFLTVLFSLTALGLYYVVYFKVVNSLSSIVEHLGEIGDTIRARLHYVYWLGSAAEGNGAHMLLMAAITLALAAITLWILSKTLMRFALAQNSGVKKKRGREDYSSRPLRPALLRRELKRFASVPTWMLNGGLGILLLPALTIAAIIKAAAKGEAFYADLTEILGSMPGIAQALPVLLAAAICLVVSVDLITPVAISIEGKNLWILQSLPVEPKEILRAKIRMGVLLGELPALFAFFGLGLLLRLKARELLPGAITVAGYVLLQSNVGLMLNLKRPNFIWTNAATITKQGMPIMVSMFGGWFVCLWMGVLGLFLARFAGAWVILTVFCAILIALWLLTRRWITRRGAEIFMAL